MSRLLAILSLLLCVAPVERAARIVIVEPPGETYDAALGVQAAQATAGAAAWWHALSPITTTVVISETQVVTTSADVLADLDWMLPYLSDNGPLTIYVLDNRVSGRLLWGDAGGTGSSAYGGFVVVTAGGGSLDARIAHELGHALYRLPDVRVCTGDIMCNPGYAYAARVIGCASLAGLGAPCKITYLPLIVRG